VGEPRSTPKGQPLSGRWKDSYCTFQIHRRSEKSLPDQIAEALELLTPYKKSLDRLVTSGGHLEFFVGWFLDGNSGDILEHQLLGRLAEMQISLSLDIYGPR
jgi:hypothetical protein